MFAVESVCSESEARTGRMHLPHGDVPTPMFMPVGTNGTVKAMLHNSLSEIGYKLILGNTYHLKLRPGVDVIRNFGGLHEFSSWNGNILTDSGGFQVFSLAPFRKITEEGVVFRSHLDGSEHSLTPESVVDIQTDLGSDIQMQLDVCTPPGITEKEAEKALELTSSWARRAKQRREEKKIEYKGHLFGIVQGNFFKHLRKRSAESLAELDFPGYAIGGLSVGEPREEFSDFLHYTSALLPKDKPKYVMGIGTPDYILEAVSAGVDIFDCVYPTRIARNGTCFTSEGSLNLKNAGFREDKRPIEEGCSCPACRLYSRAYLRHLFLTREILGPMLLTYHNLQFLHTLMKNIQNAICTNQYTEFKTQFLKSFQKGQ